MIKLPIFGKSGRSGCMIDKPCLFEVIVPHTSKNINHALLIHPSLYLREILWIECQISESLEFEKSEISRRFDDELLFFL